MSLVTIPMANPTTYVIQVHRGNMRMNFPLTAWGLWQKTMVFAHSVARGFVELQSAYPERADIPIKRTNTKLVLKLPSRDDALRPQLALWEQLKGEWSEMDVSTLGDEGLTQQMEKAQFLILHLVDKR